MQNGHTLRPRPWSVSWKPPDGLQQMFTRLSAAPSHQVWWSCEWGPVTSTAEVIRWAVWVFRLFRVEKPLWLDEKFAFCTRMAPCWFCPSGVWNWFLFRFCVRQLKQSPQIPQDPNRKRRPLTRRMSIGLLKMVISCDSTVMAVYLL